LLDIAVDILGTQYEINIICMLLKGISGKEPVVKKEGK